MESCCLESLPELQLMVEKLKTASYKVYWEINLGKTKVMNRDVFTTYAFQYCTVGLPIRRYIERPSENLGCLRQLEKYYLIHDRIISKKLQLTKQGKEIPGELLDRGNAHVQTDSEPIHLKLEAFRFNLM
ncbi:hypothetical protein GQR58_016393 [Nymphon striatum]|nr:hypothetical protein GQR58_016393 [Nymphon striatum]